MLPLVALTSAWLAGIFLHGWLSLSIFWLWWLTLTGLLLAVAASLFNRHLQLTASSAQPLPSILPLALAVLCLGGLRLQAAAPSDGSDSLLYYREIAELKVTGLVSGEPVYSERSSAFRLSARQVQLDNERPVPVSGEIYVRIPASLAPQPGDLLQVTGILQEPQAVTGDDFPYRQWLARQGIHTSLSFPRLRLLAVEQDFIAGRWLRSLQQSVNGLVAAVVPGEQGALLTGILLNDKTRIPVATRQAFTNSGVAHILAVSGSNISILIMLVTLVLNRIFSRRVTLWLALGTILFYVLLVGAGPSVLRAGLMGGLATLGWLLGREYSALAGLAGSAFLMTLWQPTVFWDIGFELSFVATLGLVLLARPWQARTRNWLPLVRDGLIVTVAAEIFTLPLVMFYFHQLSLVSLLTNLLVLPVLPFIMALGALAVLAGAIFNGWLPLAGQAFGGLVWFFLTFMLVAVKLCAGLPFSTLAWPAFHPVWLLLYYSGLSLVIWWSSHGRRSAGGQRLLVLLTSKAGLLSSLAVTVGLWVIIWWVL